MAAVASPDTVKIVINDVSLEVPKGELIVDSVKRLGLEIPIFCYHARLKPVGMCRMCLVEVGFAQPDGSVRKMPKPQAGCTLPASDGMVVYTDTEMVHRDRKGVLEFLLINHPLDCPICDRGGECPLQNNTIFYGPSTSRYTEVKRHLPKAFPLSEYVTLDLERCIQCGRCVRFTEEISGDSQLAFRFRGAAMQPSTFELRDFTSKFSGNVIEICPVGALTSTRYRFRARPWDLETKPAICTVCSNGCNIWFDYRVGKMVRINGRTNEAVNEEWTCDRGKFGHEFYNAENRLTSPLIREGDKLVTTEWSQIYEPVLQAFGAGGAEVAGLTGPQLSNEALFLFGKLFRERFGSNNIDHRWGAWLSTAEEGLQARMGVPMVQSTLADIEAASKLFVFGTTLADELPIFFLRVRKAWFQNGAQVVVAHDGPTDVDAFARHVLRYRPGTGHVLAAGLLQALVKAGGAQVPAATAKALGTYTPAHVEAETGIPAAQLEEVAAWLAGATILSSHALFGQPNAQDLVENLAGVAMTTGGRFNCYALGGNDQGATEIGLTPRQGGLNTRLILEACAAGSIKALWLAGVDPFDHAERELVERALEAVEFLVVQGIQETEAMAYASVVLPMTAPAEETGTWTNAERRVQRMEAVLAPKGLAKPGWRILNEFLIRSQAATPFFNADEVFAELAATIPTFAGLDADRLPAEGALLNQP